MKTYPIKILAQCAAIILLSYHSLSYAGGYRVYEIGAPIVAAASAGQAAVADDASSSFLNPAGMTQLRGDQLLVGTQIQIANIGFNTDSSNTITGIDSGNAGGLFPGVGMFYVHPIDDSWRFGMSVTSPYVGGMSYFNGWSGRYTVQDVFVLTVNANPVVAYKVNDFVSIGGGFSVEYAKMTESLAIPLPAVPDGGVDIKLSDFAWGGNIGILLTPKEGTRIGLTYRTQITHNLHGTTTFQRIPPTPLTRSELITPHTVLASLVQKVSPRFDVLADLGWEKWSEFNSTPIQLMGMTINIPRHWRDTWRAALGGQFHLNRALTLRSGISYDSSPTTTADRLPDLPMDRQIRVAIGGSYKPNRYVTVAGGYEFIQLGAGHIFSTTANGTLSGCYQPNHAHVLTISINATFP